MRVAIVTTGDEIMSGNVVDSNFAWIADQCWMLGLPVVFHAAVADDEVAIGDAVMLALDRADVVTVTGGLGPTEDDITLSSVAKRLGLAMIYHPEIEERMKAFFEARRRSYPPANARQAWSPEGASFFENKVGTAPGVRLTHNGRTCFFLPGVPNEMMPMMIDSVVPWLTNNVGILPYAQRVIKTYGLPEAEVGGRLAGLTWPDVRLSYRVRYPETWLKLVSRASDGARALALAEADIRNQLGDYIYGVDDDSLASVVVQELTARGQWLAVAESCTGGLVADMLTNIPGASQCLERGAVSYSNRAKEAWLGVNPALIATHGAVSEAVAKAMADGIRQASGATIGLSTTGVAGPTGGSPDKPVGTVWIGLSTESRTTAICHHFLTDRKGVKVSAATAALNMVRKHVLMGSGG